MGENMSVFSGVEEIHSSLGKKVLEIKQNESKLTTAEIKDYLDFIIPFYDKHKKNMLNDGFNTEEISGELNALLEMDIIPDNFS